MTGERGSIRRELIMMIMLISVVSIVLTTIIMSVIGYQSLERNIEANMRSAAALALDRNAALLDYTYIPNLRRRAFRNLVALSRDKNISLLCMYNAQIELSVFYDVSSAELPKKILSDDLSDEDFAEYIQKQAPDYEGKCRSLSKRVEDGETLVLDLPIPSYENSVSDVLRALDGDKTVAASRGRVLMAANLNQVERYLKEQLVTSFLIILGVVVLCYLLAIRMQKHVSSPILRLAEVARHVSLYKDYSLRIEGDKGYSSEITQLMESFNSMLSDIEDRDSRLMRKNIELERAKESAISASIAKTQFLANISHELRTPLNAIIGFSSIIINQLFGKIGNDRYIDYGRDIHDSGVHLLEIINDILDLSKAEAGKLTLKYEAFDIKEAIQKCYAILSERAKEGEVAVELFFPDDMPNLVADRVRFIQIMLNLMSNAIKFTDTGGRVDVTITAEENSNNITYFIITVKDTGMGMRKEDIDTAFQAFGQLDSGLDRKYEGTGLGLPLTKKLVELHNATIRIESEISKGTEVILRFVSDPSVLDESSA